MIDNIEEKSDNMRNGNAAHFTVKDALELDVLKSAVLLAGEEGLDRVIEKVSILDSPDIVNWVSGNELVVTNAYVLKVEPSNQRQLFEGLIDKGCSALAVKLGRFIQTIPEEILDLSNKKAFPIISLSFDVIWTDIINDILSEILNKKYSLLQQSENIRDQYLQEIFFSEGYDGICKKLAKSLNTRAIICDSYGNVLCSQSYDNCAVNDIDLKKLANENRKKSFSNLDKSIELVGECKGYIFIPIVVGNNTYGFIYLQYSPDKLHYIERQTIYHATTAAALQMLKQRSNENTENRLKIQLFKDIISNDAELLENTKASALSYGWNLDFSNAAVIFKSTGKKVESYGVEENEEFYYRLLKYTSEYEKIFSINRGNEVVSFISCPDNDKIILLSQIEHIKRYFNDNLPARFKYKIGVGNIYSDFRKLGFSFREAKDAIEIGQVVNPDEVVYHIDDLMVYRMIWKHQDQDEINEFINTHLGKLISEDDNSMKLINTLQSYMMNRYNINQTSKNLYIHRNTLIYRLNKIMKILGINFDDPEICFNLDMAIRMYKLRRE